MNINNLLCASIIITAPLLIHSESLLDEFERTNQNPSISAVINFLQEHQHNAGWCQSVALKLHIKRTDQTVPEDWKIIVNTVSNMIEECKKSDSTHSFPDIFGSLLKECYSLAAEGIHGKINIDAFDSNHIHILENIADIDEININFKLQRETTCDATIWNNIYNESLKFVKQIQYANNIESIELEEYLGKPLQNILTVKNMNKDLRITFKDMFQEKLSVGYTA